MTRKKLPRPDPLTHRASQDPRSPNASSPSRRVSAGLGASSSYAASLAPTTHGIRAICAPLTSASDPELDQQLIGNSLLAPERILYGHTSNQPAEFQRNGRTARPGLVAPQQTPSGAVPTDHRFRANDHQARAPGAPPREQGQARPRRGIDAPGFHAPLLEERELATKDQILGSERPLRPDREDGQADRIGKQPQNNPGEGNHASSCHGRPWTRQPESRRPRAESQILLLRTTRHSANAPGAAGRPERVASRLGETPRLALTSFARTRGAGPCRVTCGC